MSFITALFLFGLYSQRSLAKSLSQAEPNTGCTDFCVKSIRLVSDQQLTIQLKMNNMENNWKIQHEWAQNLVNQDKLENRQTLEAIESRLARLESVENRLLKRQGMERIDTDIGLAKQITEQQERFALGKGSFAERLEKLEDQQRLLVSGAQQILGRLAQIEKQIAVEQSTEEHSSGLEKFLSTLRQISTTKMMRERFKLPDNLNQIKEPLVDQKPEGGKIKNKNGHWKKELNGLKNQFAEHETKLENHENKLLDSQTKLEKVQYDLTSQQDQIYIHDAFINETASMLTKLWKNRHVTFEKVGSKYYNFEKNERLTWSDAGDRCKELGGHLASLQDQREFDLVGKHIRDDSYYWLDINDIENEGVYMSSTTGEKANFLKWRVAPDNWNGDENCVEVAYVDKRKVWGMNDVVCAEEHRYICEKKL